ncbi:PepSY domain-containing protein [Elioraea sp.]|uniref:PepSY domain-containing protein n=1 Tax=Elioraea sp. TaxID=2185103 RepID=UPI0025C580AC|nr:PepSY domain-containing protein [Elioraea sp.]
MAVILRLAALAALLALPVPAQAEDDCRGMPISAAQAIAIAATVGLLHVKDVDCDDDEWEVEGWHVDGREMEVEISARTGRILEVEFDD